jgi:transcriptional regulator with XRE-family HTH domain
MNMDQLIIFLTKARIAQGSSQQEVAERIGRSRATIGHIETGHANPSLETLVNWTEALGYTLEFKLNANRD